VCEAVSLLTRLKVQGFKNLVDVDVRFGPFTCIAGANGVGKSNLLDAIAFLSALADKPLLDAALSVRDEGGRTGDVRSLFHRVGDDYNDTMSFETEMIVPLQGVDELGQQAKATITFLKYTLVLAYRKDNGSRSLGGLELLREELSHIRKGEAYGHLLFPHNASQWRASAVTGREAGHRAAPFISTEGEDNTREVKIHQDGGSSGRPRRFLAASLPRTALSTANAAEGPTATMARREMQSWRLLQLEPSALRQPDPFTAPVKLGPDGSHLPAALYHLARPTTVASDGARAMQTEAQVYSRVANRLAELIDDVRAVSVDRDERRELLTLNVSSRDGTVHPARSLSDGTLRFLALAVLELDPEATGLLCMEEPENGIYPARIPAMLDLLREISTDVNEPLSADNPLRQVIINTHSPVVVGEVSDEDILVAELKETVRKEDGRRFKRLAFSCLSDTWRAKTVDFPTASRGALLAYLDPLGRAFHIPQELLQKTHTPRGRRRVIDREDLNLHLFGEGG
jgi:predicted ATPase